VYASRASRAVIQRIHAGQHVLGIMLVNKIFLIEQLLNNNDDFFRIKGLGEVAADSETFRRLISQGSSLPPHHQHFDVFKLRIRTVFWHSSYPLMPGIMMSVMTISGLCSMMN
jgi:hypothetical protein